MTQDEPRIIEVHTDARFMDVIVYCLNGILGKMPFKAVWKEIEPQPHDTLRDISVNAEETAAVMYAIIQIYTKDNPEFHTQVMSQFAHILAFGNFNIQEGNCDETNCPPKH